MANQIIIMSKAKKILKLLSQGTSKRSISELCQISRNTVDKYATIFQSHPLGYNGLLKLSDKELYSVIAPPAEHEPTHDELYGLFPDMLNKLTRKGVTRLKLWEEYKSDYPQGVQYSQFCEHFKRFERTQKITSILEHKAGDKMMVDYAGKKPKLTDPETGLQTSIEFFVAILPCSQLTYACGSTSQQTPDFLGCLVAALEYFGGVPSAIVPDNLKPAISRSSKYDPEINPSMAHFAEYYDVAIIPTRARKPKDKALVENAVNILYTRVYAPLYDKVFHTIEEFNIAVLELVNKHNRTLFKEKPISRLDQFNAVEKQELKSLPCTPFQIKQFQRSKVHPNCHVHLSQDKHHYSVPYQYVSKEVQIAYDANTVEIFYKMDRIATHQRKKQSYGYSTCEQHLHPRHRYYACWSESFFLEKSQQIGPNTQSLIQKIFYQSKHPEQGFKLCQGVLHLAKKYGHDQIEKAAQICVQYEFVSYRKLEYIVTTYQKFNLDEDNLSPSAIQHENIRGASNYQ
jgi:transposase